MTATQNGSVVIVGAGLAAANTAEALRDGSYAGPVTIVGEESVGPYERPPLSKDFLLGNAELDDSLVHDDAWYSDHDIAVRTGTRVTSIDRDAKTVSLDDGSSIGYDTLVLATGARSRTIPLPGIDLKGVHYLRTREDSAALKDAFQKGTKVGIVGGGWIGLELAAAARAAGCDVVVLARESQPLENVLGAQLGEYFAKLHRANGVDLRLGVSTSDILGTDGAVSGIRTDQGDVPADLVIVAVGAVPNVELAKDAGIDVDNGVLTDEHLRTNDPDVLAIGDIANASNTTLGDRLRVEHWDNAIRQGKLAAQTILGQDAAYDWLPYFFTDQFDLGMEYVGRNRPDDDVVVRGDQDKGEFIVFWTRAGKVTAAMNVNVWDVNDQLRAIVGKDVAADRLADESVPLGDLAG